MPVAAGPLVGAAWWVLAPTAPVRVVAEEGGPGGGPLAVAPGMPELAAAQDGTLLLLVLLAGLVTGAVVVAVAATPPPADPPDDPQRERPTPAEIAVLTGLASGLTLQQVAVRLGLTRRGVDYRLARLRQKLEGPGGVPATTAGVVARGYALGLRAIAGIIGQDETA